MNASVLSSHPAPSLNSKRPGIIELDGSQYSALRMELEVERMVKRQQRKDKEKRFGFAPAPVRSAADTDYESLKREAAALVQKFIQAGAVKVIPPEVQAQALRDEKTQYEKTRRRVWLKCGLTTLGKPRRKASKHTNGGVLLSADKAAYMRAYRRAKFLAAGLTTSGTQRVRASKHGGQRIVTNVSEYQRNYRRTHQL